eukprot:1133831-Prymnesium_polylepis.1
MPPASSEILMATSDSPKATTMWTGGSAPLAPRRRCHRTVAAIALVSSSSTTNSMCPGRKVNVCSRSP